LSSHIIKEIVSLKGPVHKFVPSFVEEALKRKLK
jgi:phosphopantetheine adenylyltransferase